MRSGLREELPPCAIAQIEEMKNISQRIRCGVDAGDLRCQFHEPFNDALQLDPDWGFARGRRFHRARVSVVN